jgi:thiol-disulfide isomerase/thioredoxin
MTRTLRGALLGTVLAMGLAVTGCSGTHAVSQSVSGSRGWQLGDAALTWVAPGHRAAVTDVSGPLLGGGRFDLSAWHGHVVVVNFWGSWCGPCQAEAAALEQVYRDELPAGVEFVGIDVNDDVASAEAFLRSHHVTYPNVSDPSNLLALRFRGLPPDATPTTVVLDRSGRIAARHSGSVLFTTLRDLVRRAVAEST